MPSALLVLIFTASAACIWLAGIRLSDATDALDARLGLGSALGGLVLLAIATNLPEIAITVTAAASGETSLAVGNLLGGIAVQTIVLAVLDVRSRERPITHMVGSLIVVLEASIVVAVLIAAIMTTQLPADTELAGVSPGTVLIVLLWAGGVVLIGRARRGLRWQLEAPGASGGRSEPQRTEGTGPQPSEGPSTAAGAAVFALAALVRLAAGVAIEEAGSELASRVGLSGAIFGATVLAASTALPEVSTGLTSVKLGDHELAFADIFGGNAFLPVLFLVADLVGGTPALPAAQPTDVWIAGLGILLTAVYIGGLITRPDRKRGPLGPDSWLAVALYVLGIAGLVLIG
jgi:cation:H+ antiporter